MPSPLRETISGRSKRVELQLRDLIERLNSKPADNGADQDESSASQNEAYTGDVIDALDRFRLWAGNLGALLDPTRKLSLDQRLAEEPEYSAETCRLLDSLSEAVDDLAEMLHREQHIDEQNTAEQPLENNEHLRLGTDILESRQETGLMSREQGRARGDTVEVDPIPDTLAELDEAPFDEVRWALDNISGRLRSLFRLAAQIRKSGPRDRFQHAMLASRSSFPDIFDMGFIRERHPKLCHPEQGWLLKRLGGANAKRRQFLKYCRDHKVRLSATTQLPKPQTAPSEALEEVVMPEDTPTELLSSKATTFVAQVAAAQVTRQAINPLDNEPDDDWLSQASASTTTTAFSTLKLPSLGDISPDGEPFECPLCRTIQEHQHERAWRAHAFMDLKAYVCTAGRDCHRMFGDRNAWFTHELEDHRVTYVCHLCTDRAPLSSASELGAHISSDHSWLTVGHAESLLAAGKEPQTKFKARDCPFCDEWATSLAAKADWKGKDPQGAQPRADVFVSMIRFRRHVAAHQEQLAIFCLPRAAKWDDADNDTLGSRAVAFSSTTESVGSDAEAQAEARAESPGRSSVEDPATYGHRLDVRSVAHALVDAMRRRPAPPSTRLVPLDRDALPQAIFRRELSVAFVALVERDVSGRSNSDSNKLMITEYQTYLTKHPETSTDHAARPPDGNYIADIQREMAAPGLQRVVEWSCEKLIELASDPRFETTLQYPLANAGAKEVQIHSSWPIWVEYKCNPKQDVDAAALCNELFPDLTLPEEPCPRTVINLDELIQREEAVPQEQQVATGPQGGAPSTQPGRKRTLDAHDEPEKRFACPYFKHNPVRFELMRPCWIEGWPNVSRLKEHLYAHHMLPPFRCLRCLREFDSELLLAQHQRAETPCASAPASEDLRFGQNVREQLEGNRRLLESQRDKWEAVYMILFPGKPLPDSPYYDYGELEGIIHRFALMGKRD